jgi:putative holliday junction resolvase
MPEVPAAITVMAFDFGTKRVGVAVGNGITRSGQPLAVISTEQKAQRMDRVAALIKEWRPDSLVVGVPRHPDGTAHEMTLLCEKFGRQLAERFRLPVTQIDERYTSAVLEQGRKGSEPIDAQAAALILEQFFRERLPELKTTDLRTTELKTTEQNL